MNESGWSTPDQRAKLRQERIIELIQSWEGLLACGTASAEHIRLVEKEILSSMFPKRVFHFNGKRYRKIANQTHYRLEVTDGPSK